MIEGSDCPVYGDRGTVYEGVLLAPSFGSYGMKEIAVFEDNCALIVFGRLCSTQLLGGVQITPNSFCNYGISMIFNNWKDLILYFFFLGWRVGFLNPSPLVCSLLCFG